MNTYIEECFIQNYRDRLQDETRPKAIAFLQTTLKQLTNDSDSRSLPSSRVHTINTHSAHTLYQTQTDEGFKSNTKI